MPPTAGAAPPPRRAAKPRLPRASCRTHPSPPASVDARHPDHRVSGGYGLIAPGSDRTATTLSSSHSVVSEAAGFRPTRSWKWTPGVRIDGGGPVSARVSISSIGVPWSPRPRNTSLTEELTAELAGFSPGSLDGLDRLPCQGKFTESKSSTDSILALQDFVSPVAAFVRDGGEVGIGHEIPIADHFGD